MNSGPCRSRRRAVGLSNSLGVYNLYKSQDPRDWESNLASDFPDLFPRLNNSAIAARQAAAAAVYGANPEEVVLSYNTTDACNLIFAGTPWKAGDRIITTTFEHPALAGPIAWARDYHGVEVVVIDMPSTVDSAFTVEDMLAPFRDALMQPLPGVDNKQYVAFSETSITSASTPSMTAAWPLVITSSPRSRPSGARMPSGCSATPTPVSPPR